MYFFYLSRVNLGALLSLPLLSGIPNTNKQIQCVVACLVHNLPSAAMALKVFSVLLLFAFILAVNFLFYLAFEPESHSIPKFVLDFTENTSKKPTKVFSKTYLSVNGSLQQGSDFYWKKVHKIK